jgi:hypothetical protein
MAITLWHFIYEAIILPSVRQDLRNQLFRLRDELRSIAIDGYVGRDVEAFNLLHESLNGLVNRVSLITFSVIFDIKSAIHNDKHLEEKIKKRQAILDDCLNTEVKKINEQLGQLITTACIANSGGWLIYIIPLVTLFFTGHQLISWSSQLIATPKAILSKAMIDNDHFNACV